MNTIPQFAANKNIETFIGRPCEVYAPIIPLIKDAYSNNVYCWQKGEVIGKASSRFDVRTINGREYIDCDNDCVRFNGKSLKDSQEESIRPFQPHETKRLSYRNLLLSIPIGCSIDLSLNKVNKNSICVLISQLNTANAIRQKRFSSTTQNLIDTMRVFRHS